MNTCCLENQTALRSAKYKTGRVLQMLPLDSRPAAPFHGAPFSTLHDTVRHNTVHPVFWKTPNAVGHLVAWSVAMPAPASPSSETKGHTVQYSTYSVTDQKHLLPSISILSSRPGLGSDAPIPEIKSLTVQWCGRVHKIAACVSSIFTCN